MSRRRWMVLLLLGAACRGQDPVSPERPPPTPAPPRLEVGWISREPRLPPPGPDDPAAAGWPEPGSEVTWVAHVLNRDTGTADQVRFRWLLDGAPTDSGTVNVPAGESEVRWKWPWTPDRRRISFELAPRSPGDTIQAGDSLTVLTHALSVGFWVHQSIYRWVLLQDGRYGFEHHAQHWLEGWNDLLGRRTWPSSPGGVLDRLRLDRVVVLPDTAGYPREVDTDLVWFFRLGSTDVRFLNVEAAPTVLDDQAIVLHEMLHERGAVDLYAYKVLADPGNGSDVGILENGERVVGTPAMPLLPGGHAVYEPPLNGIMGSMYVLLTTYVTEHTAYGLNMHAGLRTPRWTDAYGNHIDAFRPAYYVNLIPDTTRIRLTTRAGEPIANAHVEVFASHGKEFYQDVYLPDPDRVADADADGVFELGSDILQGTYTLTDLPNSWTLILRVTAGQQRAYVFLPGYELNLLYFRGATHVGDLDLKVSFP